MLNSSKLLNGKALATHINNGLKIKVSQLAVKPRLSVILVGERKDSKTYVDMKRQAAQNIGIDFQLLKLSEMTTQQQLLSELEKLNNDDSVNGIIVQLPLPSHLNKHDVILCINPSKDVDGFHPLGFGKLALEGFTPLFMPCTPVGVMELFNFYNINLEGQHIVILGKSNIVGLPMSLLLLKAHATVTVCNAKTLNEIEITRQADILISAVGIPHLVKKDWIKEGAIVIDIGINTIADSTKKSGYRIVGDVDFDDVIDKVKYITPVPGGIGPMTVAMLMQATVKSYENRVCAQIKK